MNAQASFTERLQFLTTSRKPGFAASFNSGGGDGGRPSDQASPAGRPGYVTFHDVGEASFRTAPGKVAHTSCGEAICSRQGQVGASHRKFRTLNLVMLDVHFIGGDTV